MNDDIISSLSDSLQSSSISAEEADDEKSVESNPLDCADTTLPSKTVGPSPSTRERERGEEELLPQPSKPSQSNQPSTSAQPGPSTEETQQSSKKIKFVINVPMWVPTPDEDPETDIMSQCQKFLDLLETTGFNKEDQVHLKDVAIIIGLNGEDDPERKKILKKLLEKKENSKCRFEKISFTWGPQGDIQHEKKTPPYQKIREYLKNDEKTKKLVREIREDNCLVYFSFIDADTVSFNQVYSSYLQIVQDHSNDHSDPPTVMTTGYEFPEGKFKEASQVDRKMRIKTAKHFPLGTYYPEPNFCVLLSPGVDTLLESFIDKRSQSESMESPVLIRQVKMRDMSHFSAIFADGKPIITTVPLGSKVDSKGLTTTQSHLIPHVWATGAYTHLEMKYKPKMGKKRYYNARGYLIKLLTCDDEEFEKKCGGNNFPFEGPGAEPLVEALYSVRPLRRQLMKNIEDKEKAKESEQ